VNVNRPPAIVPQQHRIHPSARVCWVNRSYCTLLAPRQHPLLILHLYPPPTHTTSPPPCPHIQSSTASSTPTGPPTGSSTSSTSSCGRARIWAVVRLGCGESFVEVLRKDGRTESEANRFWWRDTRLAEIASLSPPPLGGGAPSGESSSSSISADAPYSFPYPTTLLPIPYHTSTTLEALDRVVVPAARSVRVVDVRVPVPRPVDVSVGPSLPIVGDEAEGGMDIEPPTSTPGEFTFGPTTTSFTAPPPIQATITTHHQIAPDGLLLYLAEASYEPGTSPLSSWVPLRGYEEGGDGYLGGKEDGDGKIGKENLEKEGPLDLFQRYVSRPPDNFDDLIIWVCIGL